MEYTVYEDVVNLLGFIVFMMLLFMAIGSVAYIIEKAWPYEDED